MKKIYSFLAVVLFASLIASCSNGDSSTNGGGGGATAPKDSMIVTVNGTTHTWHATGFKGGTTIQVSGIDGKSGENVSVSLTGISAPGTFSTSSISTITAISYGTGSTSDTYGANLGSGTGTVVVSQLTPNFIGTFSGTLNKTSGSGTGSITITNGSFNVVIP